MTPWERAQTALAVMAMDPTGLGGITVRGRVGPARDAFVHLTTQLDSKRIKLHPTMTNEALDGSIDLTATLDAGQIIRHAGLLSHQKSLFTLAMAERTSPYLAARLAIALDANQMHGLIALDEGTADENIPHTLSDRLAFCVTLDDIALADLTPWDKDPAPPHRTIQTDPDLYAQLVGLAINLGITSLRAPSFALRTAKAHAALNGRNTVSDEDTSAAVALVYAHRATQLPQPDQPEAPQDPQETPPDQPEPQTSTQIPDDMLLEAVLSALPAGMLDRLTSASTKGGTGAGSGRKIQGNRRGRPLPARDHAARANSRIDLLATLRAAIPWQTIRKTDQHDVKRPIIRPSDLRAKRYQNLSDRVLIFCVDASGSAAIARLNEAKGAIELLLGEAYQRRDHVALIAFRGTDAEVLLPPTRSLVQTKRRLASLPGGGGTPLAAGMLSALDHATLAAKRGQTPTIIILTDGRSNVALDGSANRAQAAADAAQQGQRLRASGFDVIMIDTGLRPDQSLKNLANIMTAHYVPLPRADARHVSRIVSDNLRA